MTPRTPITRLAVILGIALTVVVGCRSTQPVSAEDAVMCPKCEMIWVRTIDQSDPYGMTYASEKAMRCPDCESAVAHFFKTGEWEHSCKSCGDAMVHCTQH